MVTDCDVIIGCQGDALTQQPPIADWSAAVAEEEQHEGYYTDSMLGNRRYGNKRGNYGGGGGRYQRKSSLSGSYRDLGEYLGHIVCRVGYAPYVHEWDVHYWFHTVPVHQALNE